MGAISANRARQSVKAQPLGCWNSWANLPAAPCLSSPPSSRSRLHQTITHRWLWPALPLPFPIPPFSLHPCRIYCPAGSTKREPTVVGKPAEFMLENIANKFGLRREQVRGWAGSAHFGSAHFGAAQSCLKPSNAC